MPPAPPVLPGSSMSSPPRNCRLGLVVRIVGMVRARVKIGLANLGYNFTRLLASRSIRAHVRPPAGRKPDHKQRLLTNAPAPPSPAREPPRRPNPGANHHKNLVLRGVRLVAPPCETEIGACRSRSSEPQGVIDDGGVGEGDHDADAGDCHQLPRSGIGTAEVLTDEAAD
jgi:hypothetical protein